MHSREVLCFCFAKWQVVHSVVVTAGFPRVESWILPVLWQVLLVHPGFVPSAVWFRMEEFQAGSDISVLNVVEVFW